MKNYYDILGVNEQSTSAEISKAFKDLAKEHHPDRGGTQEKFQEINEAHETLKNTQKRHDYDTMRKFGGARQNGGENFNFNINDMFDENIFQEFFSGFGMNPGRHRSSTRVYRNQPRQNKNVNIRLTLSIKEVFRATDKTISVRLPSGRDEIINIKIPAGCQNGVTFKYRGMGDDTDKHLPRGDLLVTVSILDSDGFTREGNDLWTDKNIGAFDAIRGCDFNIRLLDDTIKKVKVPAGTQPGSVLQLKGLGMPVHEGLNIKGNVYIRISITIPKLSKEKLKKIENL
jgi:DnaJ-class molecular chaperone